MAQNSCKLPFPSWERLAPRWAHVCERQRGERRGAGDPAPVLQLPQAKISPISTSTSTRCELCRAGTAYRSGSCDPDRPTQT